MMRTAAASWRPFVLLCAWLLAASAGCAAHSTQIASPSQTPVTGADRAPDTGSPQPAAASAPSPAVADGTTTGQSALESTGTATDPPGSENATTSLVRDLDQILAAPVLSTAVVSVLVESRDNGEVLYRRNADTLMVPGSNMKLLTAAVAAARLGWDFRYETRLESIAPIQNGVLNGDLFVVGQGDPTISYRSGDPLETFRAWAAQLKAAGLRRISGRIVGDDDAFEDSRFGAGWSWDDFVYAYSAPVGALQFNENSVELSVNPGSHTGAPARVTIRTAGSDVRITDNHVTTGAPGTTTGFSIERFPGRLDIMVSGEIASNGAENVVRVAVDNPTLYFVTTLRNVLRAEGIAVDGNAVDVDDVPDATKLKASQGQRRVLWSHRSPTLAEIGRTMMKVSQNLYAETVFRTVSVQPGPASVKASREIAGETLGAWGVTHEQYSMADGSGLSRLNFVSASAIVRILRSMSADATLSGPFEAALPIAGRDGTLAARMKATRAEANVTAKTGTLTGVRSLSGYVQALDGERLVFSFLVNNFLVPTSTIDAVVDRAVERLADFRR